MNRNSIIDTMFVTAMSIYMFFFSNRRRHTRYIGDWSSDVCSSDLTADLPVRSRPPGRPGRPGGRPRTRRSARSEERRVGKECRSPWVPCELINKKKRVRELKDDDAVVDRCNERIT